MRELSELYEKLIKAEVNRQKYYEYSKNYYDNPFTNSYSEKHKFYVQKCKKLRKEIDNLKEFLEKEDGV